MATATNRALINPISSLFLYVLLFESRGLCESVPGMYIFGDSLVDVGNNNYMPASFAKANNPHNGIDFPSGKPTGRFSNGKNAADFLAEKVGLPSPSPYLSLVSNSNELSDISDLVTGVSFASGGAGIFNGSDEIFGQSIPLTKQVGYYSIVHDKLVQHMGSDKAQAHLSKSLFFVVIGSNDLLDYFNKNPRASKDYTPEEYVDLMVSTLKGLYQRLYELGARKFVVSGVSMIGCCPAQRRQNATSECNVEANYWSINYNDGLRSLLRGLKRESSDIHYSYFDTYRVMDSIIQDPEFYGITEIKAACCGRGKLKADGKCTIFSTYCSNRKNHLFWDLYHPTEHTSSIFANMIYSGPQPVTDPMNVEQLVDV